MLLAKNSTLSNLKAWKLYVFSVSVVLVLRFLYSYTDNESLSFLLLPTVLGISILSGYPAYTTPDHAFHFSHFNVLIERSCSGYNFWLCAYLVACLACIPYLKASKIKSYLYLFCLLFVAYGLTIWANVSRIQCAILARQHLQHQLDWLSPEALHQFVGAFCYLFLLALFYAVLILWLKRTKKRSALIQ